MILEIHLLVLKIILTILINTFQNHAISLPITSSSSSYPKQKANKKEILIPVELYNSYFQKLKNPPTTTTSSSSLTYYPPRYYVGTLGIPPFFHNLFTFDLGNPRQTILDVNICKGCNVYDENNTSIGCPDTVPTCADNNDGGGECWMSDPEGPLPSWSYVYTYESCDSINETSAGYLPQQQPPSSSESSFPFLRKINQSSSSNIPICTACFDAGNHSRFYALAKTSYYFHLKFLHPTNYKIVGSLPHDYIFGALVRTVPQQDRIWSNIGLGYNSSFLQQMDVTTFMFDNSLTVDTEYSQRSVILHPEEVRFNNSPFVHFDSARHRQFHLHSIQIGDDGENNEVIISNDTIFMMDTGNDGISIADLDLKYQLEYSTKGVWLSNDAFDPSSYGYERLFIYSSAIQNNNTFLNINFQVRINHLNYMDSSFIFSIPISNWIIHPSSSSSDNSTTMKNPTNRDDKKEDDDDVLLPTIFVTYDKNILGLPFLSSSFVSFVFDDENHKLFFVKNQIPNEEVEVDFM